MPILLEIRSLAVEFGTKPIIADLSFSVAHGQIVCLLGPSGCGKTTLLRTISGFERPSRGRVFINKNCVSSPSYLTPPEHRQVGMVFQDDALFPHLRIRDNIIFGIARQSKAQQQQRIAELINILNLEESLLDHYPHELSGGQRQRVSLARALAPRPILLLLDEPMSNIDVDLREQMGKELREAFRRDGTTVVLVSHSQTEAFSLADQIGVLRHGRLEQWGTPLELYRTPGTRFVADFVGEGSFLPGNVTALNILDTELGQLHGAMSQFAEKGEQVLLLIRPSDVLLDQTAPHCAHVVGLKFCGAHFLCELRLPSGRDILGLLPGDEHVTIGSTVKLRLRMNSLVVFHRDDTGERYLPGTGMHE